MQVVIDCQLRRRWGCPPLTFHCPVPTFYCPCLHGTGAARVSFWGLQRMPSGSHGPRSLDSGAVHLCLNVSTVTESPSSTLHQLPIIKMPKPHSSIIAASLVLLALSCHCVLVYASSRSLLAVEAATFECGRPDAPCGNAVPTGVTCSKGAGWCQEGYYCGQGSLGSPAKCLPVPKDCGKAGRVCCPSATDTPHKRDTSPSSRQPFCSDGSTCIYPRPDDTEPIPDPHAGITGACVAIPENCGPHNNPCCPSLSRQGANPAVQHTNCWANVTFCHYLDKEAESNQTRAGADYPGLSLLDQSSGICLKNAPDCGKVGKPCCLTIAPPGYGSRYDCDPEGDQKGYCETPGGAAFKDTAPKDLICTLCPDKAAITDSMKERNPRLMVC